MKRIVIVGAQFGDPMIYARWLGQTFAAKCQMGPLGEHDRRMELEMPDVRVEVATPAHWDPALVYEHLFREPADGVLLVLTSIRAIAHCNTMALGWLEPHLSKLRAPPIVVANDVHNCHPKFPWASKAELSKRHAIPWPIHETVVGNFDDTPALRWTHGAAEVWRLVMNR